MPLVLDPEASQCDVCLEPYSETSLNPVVLSCGHSLCRPCSQNVGTSCPFCRQWFNRDRLIKPHVDYNGGKRSLSPDGIVKDMHSKLIGLSSIHDISGVRAQTHEVLQWLKTEDVDKHTLLRSYCDLVMKVCTVTESKTRYKEKARQYEIQLRDHTLESQNKINEITTKCHDLERKLQTFQNEIGLDMPRQSNPLPIPPQPVDYVFDLSARRQSPTELISPLREKKTETKPVVTSVNESKGKLKEHVSNPSNRSPSRRRSTKPYRSKSSSRQVSDSEIAPPPPSTSQSTTPYLKRFAELLDASDQEDHGRRSLARRSYSHDDVAEYSHTPYLRSNDLMRTSLETYHRPIPLASNQSNNEYGQDDSFVQMTTRSRKQSATSIASAHSPNMGTSLNYYQSHPPPSPPEPSSSSGPLSKHHIRGRSDNIGRGPIPLQSQRSRKGPSSQSYGAPSSAPAGSSLYAISSHNRSHGLNINTLPAPYHYVPFGPNSASPRDVPPHWNLPTKRSERSTERQQSKPPLTSHNMRQRGPGHSSRSNSENPSLTGEIDPNSIPQEQIIIRPNPSSRTPLVTMGPMTPSRHSSDQDLLPQDDGRDGYVSQDSAVRGPRLRRTSGSRMHGRGHGSDYDRDF